MCQEASTGISHGQHIQLTSDLLLGTVLLEQEQYLVCIVSLSIRGVAMADPARQCSLLIVRYFCSFSTTKGENAHADNGQRHQG